MKRAIVFLSFLALIALPAAMAGANSFVDPAAAALGTASVLTPAFNGLTSALPVKGVGHGQRSSAALSSDVYVLSPDGRDPLPLGGDDSDDLVQPLLPAPNTESADGPSLRVIHLEDILSSSGPDFRNEDRRGWLALDLRQGRRPAPGILSGSQQPQSQSPATPAPEPASVMLLAMGLGVMGAIRLLRRRQIWLGA